MGHPAASSGPTFGGAESVPSLAASSVVCFTFGSICSSISQGGLPSLLPPYRSDCCSMDSLNSRGRLRWNSLSVSPVGTGLPVVLGSLDLAFLPYYHSTSATIRVRGNDRLSTHKRGRQ